LKGFIAFKLEKFKEQ